MQGKRVTTKVSRHWREEIHQPMPLDRDQNHKLIIQKAGGARANSRRLQVVQGGVRRGAEQPPISSHFLHAPMRPCEGNELLKLMISRYSIHFLLHQSLSILQLRSGRSYNSGNFGLVKSSRNIRKGG